MLQGHFQLRKLLASFTVTIVLLKDSPLVPVYHSIIILTCEAIGIELVANVAAADICIGGEVPQTLLSTVGGVSITHPARYHYV